MTAFKKQLSSVPFNVVFSVHDPNEKVDTLTRSLNLVWISLFYAFPRTTKFDMIPSGVKERGRGEGNKGKLIIRHKP